MSNHLDPQYRDLLQYILERGVKKQTRNGEVLSTFGHQIRHNMQEGFPLLTTKKMAWKQIVTELMWFLGGGTNINYLVDNDCHIWDGDAYKNYSNYVFEEWESGAINELFEDGLIVEEWSDDKTVHSRRLTKEEFINRIKTDDEFAKKWGDLGPIYGKQWRSWKRNSTRYEKIVDPGIYHVYIDQIQNLINELKTNPDSRRLMVNAWNVGELDQMVLPPCHYGFQVYTRELSYDERNELYKEKFGEYIEDTDARWEMNTSKTFIDDLNEKNIPKRAISLMWNQRSVDTFLGLPFNIASYGLLLSIIAEIVGMVPDQLIGNLGDVHLYTNHIEQAKEQITRTPYDLPKLEIYNEFWPTKSGECGVGPLTGSIGFLIEAMQIEDFQIENYQSHPAIKAPLSN